MGHHAAICGRPLVLAGVLKSGYDLALWAIFRRIPPPSDV
jgi:hypothetical protein